jgi:hypothetical protein
MAYLYSCGPYQEQHRQLDEYRNARSNYSPNPVKARTFYHNTSTRARYLFPRCFPTALPNEWPLKPLQLLMYMYRVLWS